MVDENTLELFFGVHLAMLKRIKAILKRHEGLEFEIEPLTNENYSKVMKVLAIQFSLDNTINSPVPLLTGASAAEYTVHREKYFKSLINTPYRSKIATVVKYFTIVTFTATSCSV